MQHAKFGKQGRRFMNLFQIITCCRNEMLTVKSRPERHVTRHQFLTDIAALHYLKEAEHSFSARFCGCNLARAQGFQKTNMPSTERSFYLLNTRTICVILLYNCMQCIDGFSILLQRYVTKGNDAKNPAIFSFYLLPKTQLNATHAQLLEKLRPIASAETCPFLAIQSLEFQEIWQKNRSETTRMIYHEKSEF